MTNCKRCKSYVRPKLVYKLVDGYCRHCQGALKQKPWTHSQWTEGTNSKWVKNG